MNIAREEGTAYSVPDGDYEKHTPTQPEQVSEKTSGNVEQNRTLRVSSVTLSGDRYVKFAVDVEQEEREARLAQLNARLREIRR